MELSEDQLEMCERELERFSERRLTTLIEDIILHWWTHKELLEFIEEHFQPEDWEWFYDEYIKEEE